MKFNKGIATVSVEKLWDQKRELHVVKKVFQTQNKYARERDFYTNFCNIFSFIPSLIRTVDSEKTIYVQYCGQSLNIKYQPKDRYKFKPQIRLMTEELKKFNLYHNDIRWKNIVENDVGKLFLIDFEVISTENKERDPEWILRDKPNKNENCT
jgi:thiamine kinase-like enzyme